MKNLQQRLDFSDAVAQWLVDLGHDHLERGELEQGLQATGSAAAVLSRHNRTLTHPLLEANLLQAAERLEGGAAPAARRSPAPGALPACLHVLTEALPAGGLTAMARRWIQADTARAHSVVLLSQSTEVPPSLTDAVAASGGLVHRLAPSASLVQTARALRRLAREQADLVVLHTGAADVLCGAAFGVAGGPPVMLVNHTAHTFWTGVSVADLVLNCRGSQQEADWAERHRGARAHVPLPIPLGLPETAAPGSELRQSQRLAARAELGLPADAVVMLTVGASFKYFPTAQLDFVSQIEQVLQVQPQAHLVVAGASPDERWTAASQRVGGRIHLLGTIPQQRLAGVRRAADFYVEGYPFGTTTALLEAGLDGLPAVLAPVACPPPFGTDGVAVDDLLPRHASLDDHRDGILQLCSDTALRARLAAALRHAIEAHHTGPGWNAHLEHALGMLPAVHGVHLPPPQLATPAYIHEYWADFVSTWNWPLEETAELAISHALSQGCLPRVTPRLMRACAEAREFRAGQSLPAPLLQLLCNHVLPRLPHRLARSVFRGASHLFRRGVVMRSVGKLGGLFVRRRDPRAWYQEYR